MEGSDAEVEATLAIVGPDAEEVSHRIRHLRRLAGCAVDPGPPRRLRDVYFDRGDRLRKAGLALRLRFPDAGDPVLGLKGGARRLEGGGIERRERERRWGEEAWPAIAVELERAGVPVPSPCPDEGGDPVEALRAAGYDVVQDRVTLRRPARLLRDGDAVAELALDAVHFGIGGREFVHREVEVEIGSPDGERDALLGATSAELLERFRPALRRWDHAKLATGRALEALFGEGDELPVRGAEGMGAEVYDRLEAWLAADEEGADAGGQ